MQHDTVSPLANLDDIEIRQTNLSTNRTSECKKELLKSIQASSNVFLLLKITGSYWPEKCTDFWDWLHRAWFLGHRCVLVVCALSTLCIGWDSVYDQHEYVWLIPNLANFFGFLLVIPAHYKNQLRLLQLERTHDKLCLDEPCRVATRFLVASLIAVGYFVFVSGFYHSYLMTLYYCGDFCVALYLTSNMLFLVMDLQAICLQLYGLTELAHGQRLKNREYVQVREELAERSMITMYTTSLAVSPSIIYCLAFPTLILFYTADGTTASAIFKNVSYLSTLLKDVFFIFLSFYYVARVNETSDKLTKVVAARVWDTPIANSERHDIYITSKEEPISVYLLMCRVSWKMVYGSVTGYAIALTVSIFTRIIEFFHQ